MYAYIDRCVRRLYNLTGVMLSVHGNGYIDMPDQFDVHGIYDFILSCNNLHKLYIN